MLASIKYKYFVPVLFIFSGSGEIGSQRYPCTVCGRTFASKFNLTRHNKIHTGEKQFECYICHKQFSQKVHMKAHVFAVHNLYVWMQDLTKDLIFISSEKCCQSVTFNNTWKGISFLASCFTFLPYKSKYRLVEGCL